MRIELVLPGTPLIEPNTIAGTYRITVERDDGKACGEIEAKTALSMLCIKPAKGRRNG